MSSNDSASRAGHAGPDVRSVKGHMCATADRGLGGARRQLCNVGEQLLLVGKARDVFVTDVIWLSSSELCIIAHPLAGRRL